MKALSDLPATLNRYCCYGKTCRTTLTLESLTVQTAEGQPDLPTFYRYVRRSNEDEYGPGWSTRERLAEWVLESAAEDARLAAENHRFREEAERQKQGEQDR